ncbi:MAG TPA: hypothetical protein VNE17_13790 [Nitrolancea sp.]|nr:hypothetical protein [Nitrolancea sp.]
MKRDVKPVIPKPRPRDLPVGSPPWRAATEEILRSAQDDGGEAGAPTPSSYAAAEDFPARYSGLHKHWATAGVRWRVILSAAKDLPSAPRRQGDSGEMLRLRPQHDMGRFPSSGQCLCN